MLNSLKTRTSRRPVLVILGVAASFCGLAQTEEQKIYLLGPNDALTELSLQAGTPKSNMGTSVRLIGVGKAKTFTEIPGVSAPVRLQSGAAQVFVLGMSRLVKLTDPLVQGAIYATVVKLDVNKKAGTREVLAFSYAGGYGIGKTHTQAGGVIPLNFSRFNDHAIRIEPRSTLPPGEYAFSALPSAAADPYTDANKIWYYCFGIE
jgi:hypothetical protein